MDLDKELESLEKNPEKELEKMSSNVHNKNKSQILNMSNHNTNSDSNKNNEKNRPEVVNQDKPSGPNVKNDKVKNDIEGSTDKINNNKLSSKSNKNEVDKYESIYKGITVIGEALISKLKLIFYMPYAFFMYYVPDYLEEKGREKIGRKEGPGIIAGILVLLGFLGIDYINHSFKFIKYVVVTIAIVVCLIDADNSRK